MYEGPFKILRRRRRGAYVLKDRLGERLKRSVPPDQLRLATRHGDDPVVETNTYQVKEITMHRSNGKNMEYYVIWKDETIEPSWTPAQNFDDMDVIKSYCNKTRPTGRKTLKELKNHRSR